MSAALLIALGLAGALALAGVLRLRRRAAGPGAAADLPSGAREDSGPDAAAWVARITERIPLVARRLAEQAPEPGPGAAALQGNLAQVPLHDLLQYLALGRKTGVLEIVSGRRSGRIALEEGRLARCAYRGKEGLDAAFLMLDLQDGDFEFREGPGPPVPPEVGRALAGQALEAVDAIMFWMARKPKRKSTTSG